MCVRIGFFKSSLQTCRNQRLLQFVRLQEIDSVSADETDENLGNGSDKHSTSIISKTQNETWDKLNIISELQMTEVYLKNLALNVSTENVTLIEGSGFRMASVTINPTVKRSVTFKIDHITVTADVGKAIREKIVVGVTDLDLSIYNLDPLFPDWYEKDGSLPSVYAETHLLPGSPYLNIAGYAASGRGFLNMTVAFSFPVITSKLNQQVSDIMKSGGGRRILTSLQPRCSFIDFSQRRFSQHGCQHAKKENTKMTICACNHTTMFAVLLTATTTTIPRGVQASSNVHVGFLDFL